MRTIVRRRSGLLGAVAFAALAVGAGPTLAANVIKIDATGTGGLTSLTIAQDAAGASNVITANGAAGGAALPIRGKWATLSITQNGADNVLSGALTATAGSTTGSLTATYGVDADTGNNSHSLTIGGTTAPANPTVVISVSNTDAENTANTITDVLDGSSLTYNLTVDGTDNTIANTVQATGANTTSVTANGDTNSITNTVTGATSASVTVAVNSDGNTVTNTSAGSGAKVISASLPVGGANGNTVTNAFGSVAGAQTSNLTVTGVTSRVNFGLTSSASGTVSNVNLNDVVGAAAAAGKLTLTQSGAGSSLALTVNGGAFTMGSSLAGGAGVVITQASASSVLDATVNAGANGYTYTITQ